MTYAEALHTTLAAEHAALYVYGALGAQTSQSGAPTLYDALTDAYNAHRARRDQLVAILTDLGEQPVAAEPVYELPENLDSTDAVTPGRWRSSARVPRRTPTWWQAARPRSGGSR